MIPGHQNVVLFISAAEIAVTYLDALHLDPSLKLVFIGANRVQAFMFQTAIGRLVSLVMSPQSPHLLPE